MIVDTMTADEVRKEHDRDLLTLMPIVERMVTRLFKKVAKAGKTFFQKQCGYQINRNYHVVNYVIEKDTASVRYWIYVTNTDKPYFLARLTIDDGEEYYAKVNSHAILKYTKRTPDYVRTHKEAFAKEAMIVAQDLAFFYSAEANIITPEGLWPLESVEIVNGFLRVKTFIHKSILNKRQTRLYKQGLKDVKPERVPIFKKSLKEFGISINTSLTL